MKKTTEITEPRNLKKGDILVYDNPEPHDGFTMGKEYTINRFYENGYGIIVTDDKGRESQICNSNVINFFLLVTDSPDNVNHPSHYTSHPSGIECIEVTRYYCFDIGNAIKYLWRAGLKKDASLQDNEKEIEDLEKAIWYINDRIKQLKNEKQAV